MEPNIVFQYMAARPPSWCLPKFRHRHPSSAEVGNPKGLSRRCATFLFVTRDNVPWSIVPRCPRVLQVLPTMSDSWECESWDTWELSDIVGSTCNTLGQRGTMLHGDTVPYPKEKSCIVWPDL